MKKCWTSVVLEILDLKTCFVITIITVRYNWITEEWYSLWFTILQNKTQKFFIEKMYIVDAQFVFMKYISFLFIYWNFFFCLNINLDKNWD